MARIAFGVEYVGTQYSGWQSQTHQTSAPAIQTVLQAAISSVANHPVNLVCAGRTDAGVHAAGQVLHCDVNVERTPYAWVFGCNSKLPKDVRVTWMQTVAADFSARSSAVGRHYKYIIYNSRIRPGLLHEYMAWYHEPLDVEKMQQAADFWIGSHDFSSFRGAGCQSKSPIRNVKSITVERRGKLIIIDIMANAFLYHMVRNMVGVLLAIGSSRRPVSWAQQVLQAKCRTKAGITAVPEGLYLMDVLYPASLQLPQQQSSLWFLSQEFFNNELV